MPIAPSRQILAAIALSALPLAASAQELDVNTFYWARTTLGVSDNDNFAAEAGVTWRGGDWTRRISVLGGVRNEDWSGEYPGIAGARYFRFHDTAAGQEGYSLALNWAEDRTTVLEGAYGRMWDAPGGTWRATIGLAALADADKVPGRDALSPFVVGERTWYPRDWASVGIGAQADDRGALVALRGEVKLAANASFRLEWSYTDAYYDYNGPYFNNDIRGGLWFTLPFDSLRARDRALPVRLVHRFAEAQ